jgi:hypothetical protein
MKESHIEGVANHGDPESCVGAREGDGEALTGARTGRVLSREITLSRVPTLLSQAEGHTSAAVLARRWVTLRGRRPLARAESSCAEAGRSLGRPSRSWRRAASERPEAVPR